MSNSEQPKDNDAVMGGQNTSLVFNAVLGGIQGVKQRLATGNVEQRIAALEEALNYSEAGLDLVRDALNDPSKNVQIKARELLGIEEPKSETLQKPERQSSSTWVIPDIEDGHW